MIRALNADMIIINYIFFDMVVFFYHDVTQMAMPRYNFFRVKS